MRKNTLSINLCRVCCSVILLLLLLILASCAQKPLHGDTYLLGTLLRITIHDKGIPRSLIDDAFARVQEIEARMSISAEDYDTTELLALNRAAGTQAVTVSPDTFLVLQAAKEYSVQTNGAFNVAIAPLVQLWGIGTSNVRVPAPAEIAAARRLTNYQALQLTPPNTAYLPQAGMGVDVGGIAKGYAADEAARILREAGVSHALLDFGGNILVVGSRPDETLWRIGVQEPNSTRGTYIGIIHMQDMSVVSSGPYERFFEQDGVRYHHILNSETGVPANSGVEQVTIITAESMHADALSTACFVLGIARGMALVEAAPNTEALFIDDSRNIYTSTGASAFFELTDARYSIVEKQYTDDMLKIDE